MTAYEPGGPPLPHRRYFELCARCGKCNDHCTVNYSGTESTGTCTTPQDIALHLLALENAVQGPATDITGRIEDIPVRPTYICTACSLCDYACPYHVRFLENLIHAREWIRQNEVEEIPKAVMDMENDISRHGNPFGYPRENRDEWVRDDFPVLEKADVVYYAGCQTAYQLFSVEKAILKVLSAAGQTVTHTGTADLCCGRPFYFSGKNDKIDFVARHNVDLVKAKSAKVLVASCSSCYLAFKKDYPPIVGVLPFEVYHTAGYFHILISENRLKFHRSFEKKVIYHDPCELSRGGGIVTQPREVLKALPGLDLMELDKKGADGLCCGGGGMFEAVDEDQSYHIGEAVVAEAYEKGADVLATACPTCNTVFNMARNNLMKKGKLNKKFKIMDIAEIIAKCL